MGWCHEEHSMYFTTKDLNASKGKSNFHCPFVTKLLQYRAQISLPYASDSFQQIYTGNTWVTHSFHWEQIHMRRGHSFRVSCRAAQGHPREDACFQNLFWALKAAADLGWEHLKTNDWLKKRTWNAFYNGRTDCCPLYALRQFTELILEASVRLPKSEWKDSSFLKSHGVGFVLSLGSGPPLRSWTVLQNSAPWNSWAVVSTFPWCCGW